MNKRYEIIDSSKGIGMISVMIGHSVMNLPLTNARIGLFVYLYHLMIFYFTAGFVYDEKYNDNLPLYIGKRGYGIIKPYVLYNTLFVLLHNILISFYMIGGEKYTIGQMVTYIANGFVMQTCETMLGAFWFLPVLLVSCAFFAMTFSLANKISQVFYGNKIFMYSILTIFMAMHAAMGIWSHISGINFLYHIQTAFLAIPVLFIGWVVKKNMHVISKFICTAGFIVSGLMLCGVIYFNITTVELAKNILGNVWLYYPVTLLGIYFCLCLSETMLKIPPIHKMLTFVGRYSFHFMALHFVTFKIIDRSISLLRGDPASAAVAFPHTYELGLLYTILSVIFINAVICIAKRITEKFCKLSSCS